MTRAYLKAVWRRTIKRLDTRHDFSARRRPTLRPANDIPDQPSAHGGLNA